MSIGATQKKKEYYETKVVNLQEKFIFFSLPNWLFFSCKFTWLGPQEKSNVTRLVLTLGEKKS